MTSPLQQKIKIHGPVIVTANRLADGVVIHRTSSGWSTEIADAAVVTTSQAALDLLGGAQKDRIIAVDPYVAPVVLEDGKILPGNLREQIRVAGPTVALPSTPGL